MNPAIRVRWLAALRSGEHVQGRNFLRCDRPGGPELCCLGVLCELAVADGVVVRSSPDADDPVVVYHRPDRPGDVGVVTLPRAVVDWAGLPGVSPVVDGVELTAWNDGQGEARRSHTFAEIADLLEESDL